MRTLAPIFVAVAAIAAGLFVSRLRARAGAEPRPPLDPAARRRLRRLTVAVWVGLVITGLVLLSIGWWAWGAPPPGVAPQASASVAFMAAAMELFLWGVLTPRTLRRDRPPLTP